MRMLMAGHLILPEAGGNIRTFEREYTKVYDVTDGCSDANKIISYKFEQDEESAATALKAEGVVV